MAAIDETGVVLKPLVGTDDATVDAKGRILLGKKMRDRLGDNFAMAIGELGCICVYPEAEWAKQLANILKADPLNEGRKWYSRLFFGTADDEMSCDAQGRVVIPKKLKELGKLREVVEVVGAGDHLEIWDPEEYKKSIGNPGTYGEARRAIMKDAYLEMNRLTAA